jgi:hypothetical protein
MSALSRVLIPALFAVLASGCASTSAPPNWLPAPDEADVDAYGAWAEVLTADRRLGGELIAVSDDSLYVFWGEAVAEVARDEVEEALVTYSTNAAGMLGAWGALGALSTLSHGYFLIISGSVWLIGAVAAASTESYAHRIVYPEDPWEELRAYARFPQGLSDGLDRSALFAKRQAPSPRGP